MTSLDGIESGDDEVLEAVDKGYKSDEIIEACRKLDEAGLDYRMIYLGGLAGAGKLEASAKKSAAIINQIHPYYMYLTTVSVLPGTPLYRDMMEGKFKEATEKERIKEMRELIADVNIPITVNSENAASSVNFTVDLPTEKPLILNELDKFLANFSDDAEKAMSRRRHYMRVGLIAGTNRQPGRGTLLDKGGRPPFFLLRSGLLRVCCLLIRHGRFGVFCRSHGRTERKTAVPD